MWLIYDLLVRLSGILLVPASIFSKKIKIFLKERNSVAVGQLNPDRRTILIHCPSLGEYEMVIPLIQELKKNDVQIAVSFFSPSGFKHATNESLIDYKCYLPLDTTNAMRSFMEEINPRAVVLVKNDFWFNFIRIAGKKNVPVAVVNGQFSKGRWPFTSVGSFFSKTLKGIELFIVQDEDSKNTITAFGIEPSKIQVTPDLRYDRVWSRVENSFETNDFNNRTQPTLILGSSWPAEEKIAAEVWSKFHGKMNLVIVPHDISEDHLQSIESVFKGFTTQRYSADPHQKASSILIVDVIGQLANLYRHSQLAFVGGAFGKGLHNVLEPAAFGNYIICGPRLEKFPEARLLMNDSCLAVVNNSNDLEQLLEDALARWDYYLERGKAAQDHVRHKVGSTSRAAKLLLELV